MQTNNPFRNPSVLQNNVRDIPSFREERGGSNGGQRGGNYTGSRGSFSGGRSFRGGRGRGGGGGRGGRGGSDHLSSKEQSWGKVKFNPVAAIAEEIATPWKKFKIDMIQNKDANRANQADEQDAMDFKESSDKNKRKAQILLSQQQPTTWDDFGATDVKQDDNKKQKKDSKKQKPIDNKTQMEQSNKGYKEKYLSKGDALLENFENKNMSIAQKNFLRKVITRTAILAKGDSLHRVVKNNKRQAKIKLMKLKLQKELQ